MNNITRTPPVKMLPDIPLPEPAGDYDVARDAVAAAPSLPSLPSEFADLYHSVEALRLDGQTGAIIVQFLGPCGGEGTTTIASGFARAAGCLACVGPAAEAPPNRDRLHAALFLDCGAERSPFRSNAGPRPISLVDAFVSGLPILDAVLPVHEAVGVFRARLGLANAAGSLQCDAATLGQLFGVLRERFQVVALDCSGTSEAAAFACSPHCDGTLLVIRAKRTRSGTVEAVRAGIERRGGQVIGAVFNFSGGWRGRFGGLCGMRR
ncbi:MAG: hypothetical protein ABSC06_37720 [Rhodopila sp.]|jgi:hypothetical protein